LGWGGAQVWNPLANGDRYYFHNVFLEVVVEAGWLAAIALGAALVVAIKSIFRVARQTRSSESVCLFSLLIFCCVQAQISGDINDNRWLFALMSLAIAFGRKCEPYPPVFQADYRILRFSRPSNNLKSVASQLIGRVNARRPFGPPGESIAQKSALKCRQ
jgi:O-antigen ligase